MPEGEETASHSGGGRGKRPHGFGGRFMKRTQENHRKAELDRHAGEIERLQQQVAALAEAEERLKEAHNTELAAFRARVEAAEKCSSEVLARASEGELRWEEEKAQLRAELQRAQTSFQEESRGLAVNHRIETSRLRQEAADLQRVLTNAEKDRATALRELQMQRSLASQNVSLLEEVQRERTRLESEVCGVIFMTALH